MGFSSSASLISMVSTLPWDLSISSITSTSTPYQYWQPQAEGEFDSGKMYKELRGIIERAIGRKLGEEEARAPEVPRSGNGRPLRGRMKILREEGERDDERARVVGGGV